jgi:hypothetical protein
LAACRRRYKLVTTTDVQDGLAYRENYRGKSKKLLLAPVCMHRHLGKFLKKNGEKISGAAEAGTKKRNLCVCAQSENYGIVDKTSITNLEFCWPGQVPGFFEFRI